MTIWIGPIITGGININIPMAKYKISFVVPPQEFGYGYINDFFWQQGLLYLASFLRKRFGEKISIRICDGNIRTFEECKAFITQQDNDLVGFHCVDHTRKYAVELAALAYQAGCRNIIFGGTGPIFGPQQYLNSPGLDNGDAIVGCCSGSGEYTLQELLLGKKKHEIPNFIYLEKQAKGSRLSVSTVKCKRPSNTEYLDEFPFEIYTDILEYLRLQLERSDYPYKPPTYSALSHEGCLHGISRGDRLRSCAFCGIPARVYRPHNPTDFWKEIESFNRFCKRRMKTGLQSIKDWGDSVNFSLITNLLKHRPVEMEHMHYSCYLSIADINEVILETLRKTNCFSLYIGVDGVGDNSLKQLNKGYTARDVIDRLAMVRKYDFHIEIGVILGVERETKETLSRTVEFIKSVREQFGDRAVVMQGNIMIPMPGSQVFKRLRKKVAAEENIDPLFLDVQERVKRWLKYYTAVNFHDCMAAQEKIETISPRKHSYAIKKEG